LSPLTGKNHTPTKNWDVHWPSAVTFYRRIEQETGCAFFRELKQIRFLDHKIKAESLHPLIGERKDSPTFTPHFHFLTEDAKTMSTLEVDSGVLDVAAYLEQTVTMLRDHHQFFSQHLNHEDVDFADGLVHVKTHSLSARQLIFCEGWRAQSNPCFADIAFEPVRGESIEIAAPKLPRNYLFQGEVSVVPHGPDTFLVGATYDRENLSANTTEAGLDELQRKFGRLFNLKARVVRSFSGVRPVISGRQPIIARHPHFQQCWLFNGLASSGCLNAPKLAQDLCEVLRGTTQREMPSPRDASLEMWKINAHTQTKRLTTVVKTLIAERVKNGDAVIDATAGNGNDTLALVSRVGRAGKVYAFDIQPMALERARDRLETDSDLTSFILASHDEIFDHVPAKHHGQIAAVTFNLGFLPGGDEQIITTANQTCEAIKQSLALLKVGGFCSVLCYRGHPGGEAETRAVAKYFTLVDQSIFAIETHISATENRSAPVLFIVRKLAKD
ncbi:MAG: FAD-dependent oxidoreductase, partial [Pseudomonadota bacterium]